ncbi:Hypothetical predicted protein [Paramuricea clavata]|uniref:Integrase zinc-binding domain-containing protein n=1 Tax=Paramuricea clavata TaxID=317549 RepID=A0A6S7G276_PARCT|nr:Hypothetical predicted protein [Paramuricea clavata]
MKTEVCKEVKKYCMDQWPEKDHVTPAVKPYWSVQGELTIADVLLLKGTRLVIPSRLQRQNLNQIHEGHQDISKYRERAKISVWWPGLSAQIKVMVENCTTCSKYRQQHPEPLMPTPHPQRPWQLIATDLFYSRKGTGFLTRYVLTMGLNIIVTNSPSLQKSGDSNTVPAALVIIKRTAKWNEQYKESEKHPEEGTKALLAYRSTPSASGYSPAELLMGRKIKSTIPITLPHLTPQLPNQKLFIEKEEVYRIEAEKEL